MTNRLEELTELIIEWGVEKEIPKKSTYAHQLNKTLEEVTELHKAIIDDDLIQIKDAIGDIYVTLVMAGQFNSGVMDVIRDVKEGRGLSFINYPDYGYSDLLVQITKIFYSPSNDQIRQVLTTLKTLAIFHGFFLSDAVEYSYGIIKKRKGKMIDGQFVKAK